MTEYLQIREDELQDLYAMTHRDYEQQAIGIHQRVHARSRPVSASPETCPHWVCIDHNDGDEWCCNRPAPTAPDALKQFLAELENVVARSTPDKGTLYEGWLFAYPIDRWIAYQKKQLRQSQQEREQG